MGGSVAQADTTQVPTYALTPNGGACNACRKHAANKVFRTRDAANTFRAHNGCHCSVVDGQSLSPRSSPRGDAGQSADRRDPRTGELLDKGTVNGVPVPVIAAAAPVVLLAAGGALWWWMRKRDKANEPQPADHGDLR